MMHRAMKLSGLVLAGALLSTACLAQTPTATCRAHGEAAFAAWSHGQYPQMNQYFAPVITESVTAQKWGAVWAQLEAQFGAFQKADALEPHTVAGQDILAARLHFAHALQPMALVVACDAKDRINAFRLVPAHVIPGLLQAATEPTVAGVVTHALEVSSPLGPLPATLTLPAGSGPFPAVVLVQGSGAHDRDETIGPNKPFRDIAVGLAKAGIASLRYDKRTYAYGLLTARNPAFNIDDEVTDDALTALHLLAKQPGIDPHRVFLLGHSLGAMLAPRIAQRDPQLAGIVMLAAPARTYFQVVADQVREAGTTGKATPAQVAAGEKAIEAEQALLAKADAAHPPTGTYSGAPQSYWLSLHDYHQVAVAQKLTLPIFIAQGESDFQVSYQKDFLRWKQDLAGHANATFHAYPGLSHLFRPAGKTHTIADYEQPGPVAPEVIHDIAKWIKAQPHTHPL